MAGGNKLRFQCLVAGDAAVGADVEVLEVTEPGEHAISVAEVGAGMAAKPFLSRAMAALAGNAFGRFDGFREVGGFRHVLEGRVAGGAAGTGRDIRDAQPASNLSGSGVNQCVVCPRMNVLLLPDCCLVSKFAGTSVTQRGGATRCSSETGRTFGGGERRGAKNDYRQHARGSRQKAFNSRCSVAH